MAEVSPGAPEQLRNPGYELFILALSVVSLVNLVLVLPFMPLGDNQRDAIFVIDGALSVIFLSDFAYRLLGAESKRGYFVRGGGWLDLIGSLPMLRVARIFRVLRVGRLLREYGFRMLAQWLVRERAQSALYVVGFLVVVVLEVSALLMLPLESRSPDANITGAGDVLWWGVVTITTVGYGDQFPVTTGGRVVGFFVLAIGVGLFATFTGFLANAFLSPARAKTPEVPSEGPAALIHEIRGELAEHERRSARLRSRLDDLEASLSG